MKKLIYRVLAGALIVTITFLFLITSGVYSKLSFRWVVSESMEPTISKGAFLVLKEYDEDDIPQVDDIAVFRNESIFGAKDIVHRVIATDGPEVLTKGDNNECADGYTSVDNVKYKVIWICNSASKVYQVANQVDLNKCIALLAIVWIVTGISGTYIFRKENKENRRSELLS